MLFMFGISECLQELNIAPNPTHVFRRALPLALNAHWIPGALFGSQTPLEHNFVFPAIAEVVFIRKLKSLAVRGHDIIDFGYGRIHTLEVLESIIEQLGIAPTPLASSMTLEVPVIIWRIEFRFMPLTAPPIADLAIC